MKILENTLYYGDNLEVLRKYIPDNSIDLVYLDPPLIPRQPIIFFSKNQPENLQLLR